MSMPSWSIRLVFRVLAATIGAAVCILGGGAVLAAQRAQSASDQVRDLVVAREGIDSIAVLGQRIQTNNLVRSYVPGQATAGQKNMTADLAAILTTVTKISDLPLPAQDQAATKAVATAYQAFAQWLPTIDPPRTAAQAAALSNTYFGYVGAAEQATARAQALPSWAIRRGRSVM